MFRGELVFTLSLPVLGSCGPFWTVTPCIPPFMWKMAVLSPSPVGLGRLSSVHPPAWGSLSGTSPDGSDFLHRSHPLESIQMPRTFSSEPSVTSSLCGREGAPSVGTVSAQALNPL